MLGERTLAHPSQVSKAGRPRWMSRRHWIQFKF